MDEHHRRPVALVDVGEAQAVDLAVVRLEVEPGKLGETLVGSPEGVHLGRP